MRDIVLSGRGPNALSLQSLQMLDRALDDAAGEPLLFRGQGSAFSAGLDLKELRNASSADVERLLVLTGRVALKIFEHPAPTVAMVHGHAIAGGCLLAQACDVRIGTDDPSVRIGMTGVAIGLIYPPFVFAIFGTRLSHQACECVLLGAGKHTPKDALAIGLLDEVAAHETLETRARSILAERARLPRMAYASAKRSLRGPVARAARDAEGAFMKDVVPSWTAALLG